MFNVYDKNFQNLGFDEQSFWDNWPMLYILENGQQAYIGESNHVKTRMSQHLSNEEKQIFKNAHFIYSKHFNQSVTFDYESKLIQYIVADQLFQVTNKNSGIANKDYFEKDKYDAQFYQLWTKLRKKKLVKHSLEEIENSDLFKYSPYKELNNEQRIAVDEILTRLEQGDSKRVIVKGMPGSGKTIVAVYLMKYLADSEVFHDKKIGFVVPQTSLRKTMREVFKSIYGLEEEQVLGPYDVVKERYDVLIVDEAHRLHQYKNIVNRKAFKNSSEKLGFDLTCDELDWIYKQSDFTVVLYDALQVVGPSGIDFQRFQAKQSGLEERECFYYELMSQMRVKGGTGYINFVRQLLNGTCSEKYHSDQYELKLMTSFAQFDALQHALEKKHTLCRMVAGYAWYWTSKKHPDEYDIVIQGVKKKWNHITEGWVSTKESVDEVGCIHSIQGYDLNYAFVILGKEISYDPETKQIVIHREEYFDKNGKNTATDKELLEYIKNIYYVLLTRGISGTYLYVCDDALRAYLEKYIDVMQLGEIV